MIGSSPEIMYFLALIGLVQSQSSLNSWRFWIIIFLIVDCIDSVVTSHGLHSSPFFSKWKCKPASPITKSSGWRGNFKIAPLEPRESVYSKCDSHCSTNLNCPLPEKETSVIVKCFVAYNTLAYDWRLLGWVTNRINDKASVVSSILRGTLIYK